MTQADLHVHADAGRAVRSGFPFVPRDQLLSRTRGLLNGTVVNVADGRGFAGRGVYEESGPAAVRVLALDRNEPIDGTFWRRGIERAVELRRSLVNLSFTDAWRAVNGAGDYLPGLTVESYSSYAVLRLEGEGLRPHIGPIVDAVRSALQPRGIYEKRRGPEGGRGHHLGGSTAPDALPVREGNLRYLVRLAEGEKTGFYLDMREARRALSRYVRGRQVVNCFGFTGALSLAAAAAGSPRVVTIDPSPRSVAWSRENFAANGLPPESHEFLAGDPAEVLGRIARSTRRFDLAVLDSAWFEAKSPSRAAPPKHGKGRGKPRRKPERRKGKGGGRRRMAPSGSGPDPAEVFRRGYGDLVRAAAGVLTPHGLLACTVHDKNLPLGEFLATIREAAASVDADLQVLECHGLPADFPLNPAYPQGQYLRFLVCALRK
jgi:23S rRNA (cytosine1962-C5)-methyltransferase